MIIQSIRTDALAGTLRAFLTKIKGGPEGDFRVAIFGAYMSDTICGISLPAVPPVGVSVTRAPASLHALGGRGIGGPGDAPTATR